MREWFSKIENAKAVAQRPAPSYMSFRDNMDEYQVDSAHKIHWWHYTGTVAESHLVSCVHAFGMEHAQ